MTFANDIGCPGSHAVDGPISKLSFPVPGGGASMAQLRWRRCTLVMSTSAAKWSKSLMSRMRQLSETKLIGGDGEIDHRNHQRNRRFSCPTSLRFRVTVEWLRLRGIARDVASRSMIGGDSRDFAGVGYRWRAYCEADSSLTKDFECGCCSCAMTGIRSNRFFGRRRRMADLAYRGYLVGDDLQLRPASIMNRSELVAMLADRVEDISLRDSAAAVDTILRALNDALADGRRIEIRGFGIFSVIRRPMRIGRNPRNGDKVVVPAKCALHFKTGKALREGVDGQTEAKVQLVRQRRQGRQAK
jgi:integration host factor subunit beta